MGGSKGVRVKVIIALVMSLIVLKLVFCCPVTAAAAVEAAPDNNVVVADCWTIDSSKACANDWLNKLFEADPLFALGFPVKEYEPWMFVP